MPQVGQRDVGTKLRDQILFAVSAYIQRCAALAYSRLGSGWPPNPCPTALWSVSDPCWFILLKNRTGTLSCIYENAVACTFLVSASALGRFSMHSPEMIRQSQGA